MKELRVISHKELDKMVNYETGAWRFYRGVDHRNVRNIVDTLTAQNVKFKHYLVTTAIRGLYDDVIIVKKGEVK